MLKTIQDFHPSRQPKLKDKDQLLVWFRALAHNKCLLQVLRHAKGVKPIIKRSEVVLLFQIHCETNPHN
jgi:hypothetical protein